MEKFYLGWVLGGIFSMFTYAYLSGDFDKSEPPKVNCSGYTVLDNQRVILCNGDTINYKWQYKYGNN